MVDDNQLPLQHLNQLYLSQNEANNNSHHHHHHHHQPSSFLDNNQRNNIFTDAELIDSLINNPSSSSSSSNHTQTNLNNNNNIINNRNHHHRRLTNGWISSPSPTSSSSPLALPYNQSNNHKSLPALSAPTAIDRVHQNSSSLSQASSPSLQTELYSPSSTRSPSELIISPNPNQSVSTVDSSVHASSLDHISSRFIDHQRQRSAVEPNPIDHPLFSQSHLLYHHRLHQRGIVSSVPDRLSSHHLSNVSPKLESIDATLQQKEILIEKKRRRRESHNAVERRRRDNINDRISELAQLLPECILEPNGRQPGGVMNFVDEQILESSPQHQNHQSDAGSSLNPNSNSCTSPVQKPNKGVILAKSVDYIKNLKTLLDLQVQRNRELESQIEQLKQEGLIPVGKPQGQEPNQEVGGSELPEEKVFMDSEDWKVNPEDHQQGFGDQDFGDGIHPPVGNPFSQPYHHHHHSHSHSQHQQHQQDQNHQQQQQRQQQQQQHNHHHHHHQMSVQSFFGI